MCCLSYPLDQGLWFHTSTSSTGKNNSSIVTSSTCIEAIVFSASSSSIQGLMNNGDGSVKFAGFLKSPKVKSFNPMIRWMKTNYNPYWMGIGGGGINRTAYLDLLRHCSLASDEFWSEREEKRVRDREWVRETDRQRERERDADQALTNRIADSGPSRSTELDGQGRSSSRPKSLRRRLCWWCQPADPRPDHPPPHPACWWTLMIPLSGCGWRRSGVNY